MLVLIDESGCPGFKFTRGLYPVFGLGMVIFANGEDAAASAKAIADLRHQLNHKTEFKCSKSSALLRDKFFACVVRCPFTVRALIVRKEALHRQHLRSNSDSDDESQRFFSGHLVAANGAGPRGDTTGLAMVKDLTASLGASLQTMTQAGVGTRIEVSFPL